MPLSVLAANVTIMGVQYPLYTHAHYGYGLNDAFDRSVALLVDSTEASPAHESPQSGRSGQQQQSRKEGERSSKQAPAAYNPDVMRVMQPGKAGSDAAPNTGSSSSSRGLRGGGMPSNQVSKSAQRFSQGSRLQASEAGSVSEPSNSGDDDVAELELSGGLPERAERQLRANLPQLIHPCLHNGYSKPYRRMVADGVLPKPAIVQLVGR